MRVKALAAIFAVLLLTGCAHLPEGVDGDLTDGWPAMPAAQRFVPAAGTCHDEVAQVEPADDYAPVPCTATHATETFAVLTMTSRAGSPFDAQGGAFTECVRRAGTFLGADWRGAWLIIQPVMPTTTAWQAGARWSRCDVLETDPVDGRVKRRTGSLKNALRAGSALLMTCANPTIKSDRVTELHPVACARPHTAEYAGLYASKHADQDDLSSAEVEKGCYSAIARFAKVPDDSDIRYRTGWISFPPDRAAWKLGDHAVRCFLWSGEDRLTGSYRNAGTKKLKIHYR